jgi:hypothetical protein
LVTASCHAVRFILNLCIRRRTGALRASSGGIGPTPLPPTLTLTSSWSNRGPGGIHVSTLVMLSSAVLECQKKQSRTACCASVTLCQVELDGTAPRRAVRLHQSCSLASALAIVYDPTYPTRGLRLALKSPPITKRSV